MIFRFLLNGAANTKSVSSRTTPLGFQRDMLAFGFNSIIVLFCGGMADIGFNLSVAACFGWQLHNRFHCSTRHRVLASISLFGFNGCIGLVSRGQEVFRFHERNRPQGSIVRLGIKPTVAAFRCFKSGPTSYSVSSMYSAR